MKYAVKKDCDWKSFNARAGKGKDVLLDAADLKTADGEPLPPAVVEEMTKTGCLVPVEG